MKYQYKVKNFRVFDEDGVKLDINPITILTGCNSSGKSSFVKSMLLVNKVLNTLANRGELSIGTKLDFTEKNNNLLGTFDNIIHRGSEKKNISIEYTIPSLLLNEDVVMSMTFDRHWKLNSGILSEITISRLDGTILFKSDNENADYRTYSIACCQDLRKSFFKYVFAINNSVFLDDFYNQKQDELDKLLEKIEEKESVRQAINKAKDYYESNKEWIDKIRSNDIPHTVRNRNHSRPFDFSYIKIGISNDQIYKENLLYSHILDSLLETNSDNFFAVAEAIARKGEDCDTFKLTMKYIESVNNGFANSGFDTFLKYFNNVYNDYFCNAINLDKHPGIDSYESLSGVNPLTGNRLTTDDLIQVCGKNPLGDLYNCIRFLTELSVPREFHDYVAPQGANWYVSYNEYLKLVIKEILSYRIPTKISYIPTSTINIKRLYSFDEKDEMTELFKDFILSEPEYPEDMSWNFVNRWLRKLNIGKKATIKALVDGTGCEVRIYQENDEKGQLLADFGYGISQLIFILLRIEIEANRFLPIFNGATAISYEEENERKLRLMYAKPVTIILEEPEVHLHPKFQSQIADILLDAYNSFNFHFIVETHSEYLIRKSQVLVAEMGFKDNVESVMKSPFITYYIPENSKPYSLGYRKDGKFMESFGTGFYDEASNLAFDLL